MDRRFIIIFVSTYIIGIVFANIVGADKVNSWHIFSQSYTYAFTSVSIRTEWAFFYVLFKRMRLLAFVFVGAFTPVKDRMAAVLFAWLGLSFGMVNCAIAIQYGVMYFIVITLLLLSYVFLYVLFIYGMLVQSLAVRNRAKWMLYMIVVFLGGVFAEMLVELKILPAFLSYVLKK